MISLAIKAFKPSTMKSFYIGMPPKSFLSARTLPLVFALLMHEVVQSLRIERTAMERPRMIELDDEGNTILLPATSADAGPSLKGHRPLVYRAEAPRLGSVHSFSLKNINSRH